MRRWAMHLEALRHMAESQSPGITNVSKLIAPYVAISRECGAGGSELARRIGERTGWKVLDRELLDEMAERFHFDRSMLEFLDEKSANWAHEIFGKWLDHHVVTQAEYVHRLGKVVLLAAQHGHSVFVGRGVQFLLPRESGMSVRLIAPRKLRIRRIMDLENISHDDAETFIDAHDEGRGQFVRRYFLHDVADPQLYDLVINIEHIPLSVAANLVVEECKRRFGEEKKGA